MVNSQTAHETVLDNATLLQRCMGDKALALKLTNALVGRLPDDRQTIADAVESGDWPMAARLAHRLKGSAANLAAVPLATAASNLESEARGSEPMKCLELLEQLEFRIFQLLDELRDSRQAP